jgi:hypothetical protein
MVARLSKIYSLKEEVAMYNGGEENFQKGDQPGHVARLANA